MDASPHVPDFGASPSRRVDISFDNRGDRLIGLGVVNGILKILTLGLYSFWAKTEVRRRLWSFTRFNGEPLEYTGTGKELFLGFLIVFGVVILPVTLSGFAVALLFPGQKAALSIYQAAIYLGFFLLVGNAMYRAQRYRLSRTQWRGIRGALVGSPGRYGWTYFWTLAAPITVIAIMAGAIAWSIGPQVGGAIMLAGLLAELWILPWRSNKLQAIITSDMRFGDRPLSYTGKSGPLYKRYTFAWLGTAVVFVAAVFATSLYVLQSELYAQILLKQFKPTLPDALAFAGIWLTAIILIGVITAWYRATQMNHFAKHTHFEGATFRGEATGKSLMWLVLSNWLLSVIGLLVGVLAAGTLIYLTGSVPTAPAVTGAAPDASAFRGLLALPPILIITTLTATFAQFRSARYFISRMKLDGPVNLGAIMQSSAASPKRGEGLAQVFDIDAF